MEYDYEDGHTWASYWPEALAVFAVQNNLNNDGDVVVIDEEQKRLIQDTFLGDARNKRRGGGNNRPRGTDRGRTRPGASHGYILHITVSSKSVDALADLYRFTQDQRDILHQLFPRKCVPVCFPVRQDCCCGRQLCWPLPGHTYILPLRGGGCLRQYRASRHGYSRTGGYAHLGCPQRNCFWSAAGTTATAIRCCWITARASTRYAHMTASAVTAGETVTAGQVDWLCRQHRRQHRQPPHFEVMQDGCACESYGYGFRALI